MTALIILHFDGRVSLMRIHGNNERIALENLRFGMKILFADNNQDSAKKNQSLSLAAKHPDHPFSGFFLSLRGVMNLSFSL